MGRFPTRDTSVFALSNISHLGHVNAVSIVEQIRDDTIVYVGTLFPPHTSVKLPKEIFAYSRANIEHINYSLAHFLNDYTELQKCDPQLRAGSY